MDILICNVGSTSLKYKLFDMGTEQVLASGGAERVGSDGSSFYWKRDGEQGRRELPLPTHTEAIAEMLRVLVGPVVKSLSDIACVGFKVVQGGKITGVQLLTDKVLEAMAELNSVAPAHNPPYIAAIRQFREAMPGVLLIGSFETAFHAELPPEAYLYPIPLELFRRYGIRRYGFHGASHEYIAGVTAEKLGRPDFRLVSCHLGGSASLCAVKDGKSVDTSMGLSLQCGIMNNNRIGDMDPYVIFYLAENLGMSLSEIKELLQKKSGLYGLSGFLSNDMRDLEEAAKAGNIDAENAIRTYCYGVKKYIGSYAAAMGGLDAIAFAGGIGTHSSRVRTLSLQGLKFLGVELDEEKNRAGKPGDDLSVPGSRVRIYLVETNEELIVARKAQEYLNRK